FERIAALGWSLVTPGSGRDAADSRAASGFSSAKRSDAVGSFGAAGEFASSRPSGRKCIESASVSAESGDASVEFASSSSEGSASPLSACAGCDDSNSGSGGVGAGSSDSAFAGASGPSGFGVDARDCWSTDPSVTGASTVWLPAAACPDGTADAESPAEELAPSDCTLESDTGKAPGNSGGVPVEAVTPAAPALAPDTELPTPPPTPAEPNCAGPDAPEAATGGTPSRLLNASPPFVREDGWRRG